MGVKRKVVEYGPDGRVTDTEFESLTHEQRQPPPLAREPALSVGNGDMWTAIDGERVDEEEADESPVSVDDDQYVVTQAAPAAVGEYLLIFKGEVVITGQLEIVKSALLKAFSNDADLTISEFTLLKRVGLDVGIVVHE